LETMKPDHAATDVLPEPDGDSAAHSALVTSAIRNALDQAGGWLPFSAYMEMALYAPGLGYYTAGNRKFGQQGDFVTAPETSALFGQCLALQCVELLQATGGGDILEVGAGSGVMAVDVLTELKHQQCLPGHYYILELSADLRARQQQRIEKSLPDLRDRVQWLDALPQQFEGVVLANELLDAMPLERYRVLEQGFAIQGVLWDQHSGGFAWDERPVSVEQAAMLEQLLARLDPKPATGYLLEYNERAVAWVTQLAASMKRGAAILIDYGAGRDEFYHPQRFEGTLSCHYRHRSHDNPLILTGIQDITAYVEFTALAEAAVDAGFTLAGYNTQAHFLIGSGLDQVISRCDPADTVAFLKMTQQAKVLTMPGEMGERFRVLALSKDLDRNLDLETDKHWRGFSTQDLRSRL